MADTGEQLEHRLDHTRRQLGGSIDALRDRANPGELAGQIADYAREGPAADFLANLARDIREHPLPLLLIGAGIAWAVIASAVRRRPDEVEPQLPTSDDKLPLSQERAAANTAPLVGVPGWEQPVAALSEAR